MMFSYVTPAQRVPQDHPLRPIRALVDKALDDLSPTFQRMYSKIGRPSIPPERLIRALVLQMLYSIRSERQLMEQLDFNILYRWFVGLGLDDQVWSTTVFTMENRNGLAVAGEAGVASGTAERDAALKLIRSRRTSQRATLAGDKGYDTGPFVAQLRAVCVTPHVAQNSKRRRTAIDGRTTRHPGYAISQRTRKRVEEIFGWLKTVGLFRKLKHRGVPLVDSIFRFGLAVYNLVRIRNLTAEIALW
jgi:hypothetical protein